MKMVENGLLLCIFLWVIFLVDTAQVRRSDNDLEQYLRFRMDELFSINPDLKSAAEYDRLQPPMPRDINFMCNVTGTRSPTRPTSVHRLRPGDIDVIGALGDSLSAGTGALATLFVEAFLNNQPISWSMGGYGTWRKYLTLPNIIKEFNPNLVGQPTRWGRETMNNVAGAGATSADVPAMAVELVTRIRRNPKIDFKNDWKLVTVMIGANDICAEVCYYKELQGRYDAHKKNMILALRILRDTMPRTFVNYVPVPDITILLKHNYPTECNLVHKVECPCMFGQKFEKWRQRYLQEVMKHWQQIDADIAAMEEFNNRDDFAVVTQPFTVDIQLPLKHNIVDFTALSRDCFHFSQKGYARAANAVWNNMMEPVGNKSTNWSELFERFLCPTQAMPYIYTSRNSVNANFV